MREHPPANPVHDWTGPRPLVTGTPVVIGAALVVVVLVVMVASLARRPGLAARLSQDYTAMMAGSLAPGIHTSDPRGLSTSLAGAGLGFVPRVAALEPEFVLLGGRRHEIGGRAAAAWFYRAPSAEMAIAEAFEGRVDELGPADDVRAEAGPALRLYRKTTQTVVCWQEGPLVYAFTSTLPTETVVALARRHASGAGSTQ